MENSNIAHEAILFDRTPFMKMRECFSLSYIRYTYVAFSYSYYIFVFEINKKKSPKKYPNTLKLCIFYTILMYQFSSITKPEKMFQKNFIPSSHSWKDRIDKKEYIHNNFMSLKSISRSKFQYVHGAYCIYVSENSFHMILQYFFLLMKWKFSYRLICNVMWS